MNHPPSCILIEAPQHTGTHHSLLGWLSKQCQYALQCLTTQDQFLQWLQSNQITAGQLVLLDGQDDPKRFLDHAHVLKHHTLVVLCASNTPITEAHIQGWRKLGAHHIASYFPDEKATYTNVAHTLQLAQYNHRQLERADAITQQMQELHQAIEQRNQQVEKELYLARQLQQSLLPTPLEDASNADELTFQFSKLHYQSETLRISGLYVPCDALGGDLYDLIHFKNDHALSVIMADVSGHGITAGFITAIFKALYHQAAYDNALPNSVLTHINNELSDIIKTGDYITSVACHIKRHNDRPGHCMHYSGAGHPFPYLYQHEQQASLRLDQNGMPLGWFGGTEYPMGEIKLNPGDKLLIFTDGITELKNNEGELFGEDRLDELFTAMAQQHNGPFLDYLLQDLSDFTNGQPLDDDLSMLLIESL